MKKSVIIFFLIISVFLLGVPSASASDFTPDSSCIMGFHFNQDSSPENDICADAEGTWNGITSGVSGIQKQNGSWGNPAEAYRFDEAEGDSVNTDLETGWTAADSFSYFTWMNTTSETRGVLIGDFDGSGDVNLEYKSSSTSKDGIIRAFLQDTSGNQKDYHSNTAGQVNDGNWHHVGFTYDEGNQNLTLWIDGVQVETVKDNDATLSGDLYQSGQNVRIGKDNRGASPGSDSAFFAGTIDEPRIFNKELNSTEIINLYNYNTLSTSSGNTAPELSNPSPSDGATYVNDTDDSQGIDVDLSIDFSDIDADSGTVTFYWENDTEIAQVSVSDGETASTHVENLDVGTEYSWYAEASDGTDTTTSTTYSFTTAEPISSGYGPASGKLLEHPMHDDGFPLEDTSGNGNEGTVSTGNPSLGTDGVSKNSGDWDYDDDGNFEHVAFDGDDAIKSSNDDWSQDNSISISFWARSSTIDSGEHMFALNADGSEDNPLLITEGSSDSSVRLTMQGNTDVAEGGPGESLAGHWYHVVAVVESDGSGGTDMTLYVNGSEAATASSSYQLSDDSGNYCSNYMLGGEMDSCGSGGNFYTGDLDEVKIFDQPLNSSQVSSLYSSNSIGGSGNSAPTYSVQNPSNESIAVDDWHNDSASALPVANLSVSVDDSDNSMVDVKFYNAETDSLIAEKTNVSAGQNVSVNWQNSFGEKVWWYAVIDDGIDQTTTDTLTFRFIRENRGNSSWLILPDTQAYTSGGDCNNCDGATNEMFKAQTRYACNLYESGHIEMVIHNGDLVQSYTDTGEWDDADESLSILDECGVPYSLTYGNHDVDTSDRSSTTNYNSYFPESRFSSDDWYGGSKDGNLENYYTFFNSSGREYMVLSLEMCPSDSALNWANNTLSSYSGKNVIYNTHIHMYNDGSLTDGTGDPDCTDYSFSSMNEGIEVWDKVLKHHDEQVFLASSGHFVEPGWSRITKTGANSFDVHNILSNYQRTGNGGDGWLRIHNQWDSEDTLEVQTYSPYIDQYNTTSEQEFNLTNDLDRFSVKIQSPQNQTYSDSVDLNVTSNESIETWEYSLNGGTNQTFTPNTTLENLDEGTYTLQVYGTDSSGNTASDSVTFTVDYVEQQTRLNEPEDNEIYAYSQYQDNVNIDFNWEVEGGTENGNTTLYIDENNVYEDSFNSFTTNQFSYSDSFTEGNYEYYVITETENYTKKSSTRSFSVEIREETRPDVSLNIPEDEAVVEYGPAEEEAEVEFSFDINAGSENGSANLFLDGSEIFSEEFAAGSSENYVFKENLSSGSYNWQVEADTPLYSVESSERSFTVQQREMKRPEFNLNYPRDNTSIVTENQTVYDLEFNGSVTSETEGIAFVEVRSPGQSSYNEIYNFSVDQANETRFNTTETFTGIDFVNEKASYNSSEEYEWKISFNSTAVDSGFESNTSSFTFQDQETDLVTEATVGFLEGIGKYWEAFMDNSNSIGKAFVGFMLMVVFGGIGLVLAGETGAGVSMATTFMVLTVAGLFPGWLLLAIIISGLAYIFMLRGGDS